MAEPEVHIAATPFRPSFLQSPGTPPVPWPRWKLMFDDWMLAVGFPETVTFAPRKAALLRASLGAEGARIYYSLAAAPKRIVCEGRRTYGRAFRKTCGRNFQPCSVFSEPTATQRLDCLVHLDAEGACSSM